MMFKQIGTLVASSFIIALIVWIRWMFEYVYKRVNQNSKLKKSKSGKIITNVIRCLLWGLEKFIRYTNRNAQTIAAITGHNYCRSVGIALKF